MSSKASEPSRWKTSAPSVTTTFWFVFAIAFVLRALAALVINIQFESLIFDDGTYTLMASEMAAGETARWDAFTHSLYDSTATLMIPLTALYELFGPLQIVGQLFVALFGAATAYLTARLANEVMPRGWAIATGLVVALLPSQIVFSSVTLKDPLAWALLSGIALCLALAGRTDARRSIAFIALVAGQLALLGYLRRQTLVVAAVAVALTAAAGSSHFRRPRAAAGFLVGLAVPWLFGMGPLGLAAIPDPGVLSAYRASQATGGSAAYKPPSSDDEQDSGEKADEPQPSIPTDEGTVQRDLKDLPRGLVVALLEPTPWTDNSSGRLMVAKLETLFWYPLLGFSLFAAWNRRKDLNAIAFPLVASAGLVLVYALAEGNIGTAFRHRGEVVWAGVLLGLLGLRDATAQWEARRSGVGSESSNRPADRDAPAGV